MPEVTINVDVVLLETAVWGGACAGIVALWQVRLLRRVAIVQASIVGLVAIVMFVGSLSAGGVVANVDLGTWLGFRSSQVPRLELAHRVGVIEAVLLMGVSVAVLLTAVSRRSREAGRDDAGRFCLFQAALQFVLFADPVIKIAFLTLMSASCLFWGNAQSDAADFVVTARRRFLFRLAAHGLLLLAWIGVDDAFRWNADWLRDAAEWLLPLGVLAHVLAYPFFGPVGEADGMSPPVMLDRLLVTPAALMLVPSSWLAGIQPAMLLAGAYVALMAAISSAGRRSSRPDGLLLAVTGMMLAAVAAGSDLALQGAVLLFASAAIALPILVVPQGRVAGLRFVAALHLGIGTSGAGLCLSALVRSWWRVPVDEAILPLVATVLIGAAQLLLAFALGQRLQISTSNEERNQIDIGPPSESSPWFAIVAIVSLMLLAVLTFALHGISIWDVQGSYTIPEVLPILLCVLLGAVAFTIGRMMPASKRAETIHGRKGYESADLFVLMAVLPLRATAQLCRFFDWFIIERLWDAPRQVPRLLRYLGEPLQLQSARMSVLTILLATAALLVVILGVGN